MARPTSDAPIPSGFCQCGCGERTRVAQRNERRKGHVKGKPFQFIHGHNTVFRALKLTRPAGLVFDECDRALVEAHTWSVNGDGYVTTWVGKRSFKLHRLIMRPAVDAEVDHVNHDKLDNRRANLRIVTKSLNQQNRAYGYGSSQYRGVSLRSRDGRWRASSGVNGRDVSLGYYERETDAARAVRLYLLANAPGFVLSNYVIEGEEG